MFISYIPGLFGATLAKRDGGGSTGATSLPFGTILGIALGCGGVFLAGILLILLIGLAKRKDQQERRRLAEEIQAGQEELDFKSAIQSTFLLKSISVGHIQQTPTSHLGISQITNSWKSISIALPKYEQGGPTAHQNPKSTVSLNQIAPPGYIMAPESDSKWPRGTSSKVLRNKVLVSTENPDQPTPHPPSNRPPWYSHQRRANSETQLSSILRSTSQRLKAANRRSLTRTMSTFARLPGSPPSQRPPPIPPFKQTTESREALIGEEIRYSESVRSSVYEAYLNRTPSMEKQSLKNAGHAGSKRARSPTPSDGSQDSLCAYGTPDLIIPAPLTFPSKQHSGREQRHPMSISKDPKELSLILRKNSRASVQPIASRNSMAEIKKKNICQSTPNISFQRSILLGGKNVLSPCFRKRKFKDRGRFMFAKQPLVRNAQPIPPPHQRSESQSTIATNESQERNPFQWAPHEYIQIRPRQLSPKDKGRRKGHKRSNVIRMSNLSRPQSVISVDVVPEEPEVLSPLRFSIPSGLPLRVMEPTKSPSPSPSTSQRNSMRPPTTSTFNPSVTAPDLRRRSSSKLPVPSSQDTSSPALLVCNYYAETSGGSEDEFFKSRRSLTLTSHAPSRSRNHDRNYSADQALHQEPQTLISFPPPILAPRSVSIPPRPLPSRVVSPPILLHSSSPAPPLLTMPIPGHLTGPRSPPTRSKSSVSPPPRESLQASIGMLRRMNSEISHYSNISNSSYATSDADPSPRSRDPSPELPPHRSFALSPSRLRDNEECEDSRGRSRGSQHYLSIGQSPKYNRRNSRAPDRRDSHYVYKERRRLRMMEELERAIEEPDDLMPVREVSSPNVHAPGSNNHKSALGLRFPTPNMSSAGITMVRTLPALALPPLPLSIPSNQPSQNEQQEKERREESPRKRKSVRWSDTTPTPRSATHSIRRESKMEHPSPVTPPKGLGITFNYRELAV
ncbi:hypothetical protein G7Y89_g14648 [Cudoniella acicularis]|uniref:Uncharacterized protein n=1 Tax=Cudoniella acicularis TaxID=354080 RepID=A0A8H4VRX0_9HELO|nr:hypothetical protein G7Y89_g14648 [Cudoniella acicularis]